jgi:hypothetical protein
VAVALLGAIAVAVAYRDGAAARVPFEDGMVAAIRAYERALALLGMGLALSRLTVFPRWSGVAALTAGMAGGVAGENDLANSAFVADHLFILALPGPTACVIAGLALALPLLLQEWALPVLAAALGLSIGLAIGLAAPAGNVLAFSAGSVSSGLWIVITPALLFPWLQISWARIFTRILGSWLIAIGLLLGGVRLIASKPSPEAPPRPTMTQTPPLSAAPEAIPPPAGPAPFGRGREGEFRQQP